MKLTSSTEKAAGAPRGVVPIGDCLSELLSRKNFARVQSDAALTVAWNAAAGQACPEFHRGAAEGTRPGNVRGGKLEIIVANSTLLQELTFRSEELLSALRRHLPQLALQGLRFRIGPVN